MKVDIGPNSASITTGGIEYMFYDPLYTKEMAKIFKESKMNLYFVRNIKDILNDPQYRYYKYNLFNKLKESASGYYYDKELVDFILDDLIPIIQEPTPVFLPDIRPLEPTWLFELAKGPNYAIVMNEFRVYVFYDTKYTKEVAEMYEGPRKGIFFVHDIEEVLTRPMYSKNEFGLFIALKKASKKYHYDEELIDFIIDN
jgi:hypothetical protein